MKSSFVSLAATVLLTTQYAVADPVAAPAASSTIVLKAMTSEGCYSSSTGLTFNSTYTYQTSGWCQPICVEMDQAVLGLSGGDECYCGDELPPTASKVDDKYCNDPCAGYDTEYCGGDGYYSVYLSGTKIAANVQNAAASSSSSATSGSSTTSAQPSVVTVGGATVLVTATGQASSASAAAAAKSSPSKAGIAAGVVVGVVAITAMAGGAFLFMRARKRREIEEEHRRNAAVNSFVQGGKPQSSGGSSFADTRLDQSVMAQRRMSDGSIADNQDYSRRILKVTNA